MTKKDLLVNKSPKLITRGKTSSPRASITKKSTTIKVKLIDGGDEEEELEPYKKRLRMKEVLLIKEYMETKS